MDWYNDVEEHTDLTCIKCKKKLVSEAISTFQALLYCDNKKCNRYGLYTRVYNKKYTGKHFPKFIKAIKRKTTFG